jgi:NUMOD3 motif
MPFPKGGHFTVEHRHKISVAMKGKLVGRTFSKEHRKKLSEARVGIYKDELHPGWKGDRVGYRGVHKWIERKLGKPPRCSNCGKSALDGHKIHWANINRKYRRVLADWKRLCALCHKRHDNKLIKQSTL